MRGVFADERVKMVAALSFINSMLRGDYAKRLDAVECLLDME
jgi:hypothetical protein